MQTEGPDHVVPPDCELSETRHHVLLLAVHTDHFPAHGAYSADFGQVSHSEEEGEASSAEAGGAE